MNDAFFFLPLVDRQDGRRIGGISDVLVRWVR